MTNYLKITVIMLLCFTAHAERSFKEVNPLMACLGAEELALHRAKSTGPAYFLNQHFIKELSTLYGLNLKKDVLKKICQSGAYSPSVNLLKELLLTGKKAFALPKDPSLSEDDALPTNSLGSFLDHLPSVFYTYLSKLQALTPKAGCLEKEIPEIAYFMERSKYLEDIMGSKTLSEEPQKIKNIFNKLKGFDQIIKKCQK